MSPTAALVFWSALTLSVAAVQRGALPDLYYLLPSPPCRTVLMAAKLLGTELNLKLIDVMAGDQLKPEFLKMNPQHKVPFLDDNGFGLSESRVIVEYLAEVSPNGAKLYPKDIKKRAIIDQMMYFDVDRLYSRVLNFFIIDPDAAPMVIGAPFDQRKANLLDEAFQILEEYLTRSTWVAGNEMTLADVTILTTVSLAEGIGYDVTKFPKTYQWLTKMKSAIPDYKALNEDGIEMWKNASSALSAANANPKKIRH